MGSLSLRTRRAGDRTVVSVSGELDLATVPNLRDAALSELGAIGCRTLVLDLAGLTFLDSTGVAAVRTVTISGLAPLFGLTPAAGVLD